MIVLELTSSILCFRPKILDFHVSDEMDGRPSPIVDWPMLWRDHVEKTRREQKILFFRMHGFVLPKTKKSEYYAKAEERWPYEEEDEDKDGEAEVTEVSPVKSGPSLCSVKGNCAADRATVKKVGSLGHFLELLRSEEPAAAASAAGETAGEPERGEKQ